MPTKEKIYDEQISPLMAKIIAICKEHKIANVISFSLDLDEGLCCTTCMILDEFEPPDKFREAVKVLYNEQQSPLMVTVRDGDGNVTEVNAIMPG